MKRFPHKFLSILLTLAMAVSVLPAFSIVASAETTDVCYIDAETTDGDFNEEKDSKYSSVQAAVTKSGTTPTAIVMIADSEENVTIASTQDITLDLNGYVLSGKLTTKGVIYIDNDGTNYGKLTLKDSNTGNKSHKFKVAESGLWELYTGSDGAAYTFDSENGLRTASGGNASDDIPAAGSIIDVSGGCITGGTNTVTAGGGVENRGTLNFISGNIVGNQVSTNGGGIWSGYTLNISGGNIVGNISTGTVEDNLSGGG